MVTVLLVLALAGTTVLLESNLDGKQSCDGECETRRANKKKVESMID